LKSKNQTKKVSGTNDMTFLEMVDLTDVISKVKKELPHTKPRLRK
jgi:hypothetical protein